MGSYGRVVGGTVKHKGDKEMEHLMLDTIQFIILGWVFIILTLAALE